MPPTTEPSEKEEEEYRTDSYRVAVTPFVPDDGRTSDGRPKSRRRRTTVSKDSKSLSTINEEIDGLKDQLDVTEHKYPLYELYTRYSTDPNMGLSVQRVKEVQEVYGFNRQVPPTKTPEWVMLAKNLLGGFSIILWVGCCLSLVTFSIQSDIMETPPYENLVLGIILGFVVIITGLFSFYHELKAEQLKESLKVVTLQFCMVIREGRRQIVPIEEVVMGDVLEIKAGERIPADIRIITSHNFRVDQSNLTGDLEPHGKSSECTHDNPLETMNLAFCGTYATEGSCRGLVIRVGDMTIMSRITHLTVVLDHQDVLFTDEVTWWMNVLTSVALSLALVFFLLAFMSGFHWLDSIIFLVGVLVAIVPEGLVAVVTICLTLTAKRLAKKNCLLKDLTAVERLGAVSVILVDKSALTLNNPVVAHMWLGSEVIPADNTDNQSGTSEIYRNNPDFQAMTRIAALCNQAEFKSTTEGVAIDQQDVTGDPNDTALLRFMEKTIGSVSSLRNRNRRVAGIPFSRNNKYQVSINEIDSGTDPSYSYMLLMKGAPEEIIQRCSTILHSGKEWHLDEKTKAAFTKAFVELASLGERVIGMCDLKLPSQKYPTGYPFDSDEINFPMSGLRFVGLISLADPLRPTVPDAVSKCRSAGIRVVMVTGDHPVTARAVAMAANIFTVESTTIEDVAALRNIAEEAVNPDLANAAIIHGSDLKTISPDRLNDVLTRYPEIVFARTSLPQKLHIVEGFQHIGAITVVTGVGVPDVPSVKRADIGVAMYMSDTDVVKQAADMILLDNNFATIVTAIEEGRLLFDNLRKSISYIMASNMPEFIPYLVFLLMGVPLPLGAITILLIDLGTDMLPAVSLAYESPEYDLMKRGPRNDLNDRLIDMNLIDLMDGQIGMIQAASGFFSYFIVLGEYGFWFEDLMFIRRRWNAVSQSDFQDSYRQEWTHEQRRHLEWTAHAAFFVSIVMCQWITLLACKTRRLSLFQQGFWNHHLNFALIFETVLTIFLIYCPGMDLALHIFPLRVNFWLPPIIFCLVIFIYDECRRLILRKNPSGFIERHFY